MNSAVIRQGREGSEQAAVHGRQSRVTPAQEAGSPRQGEVGEGASVTPGFSSLAPQTKPGPHTTCPGWMTPYARGILAWIPATGTELTVTYGGRSHEDQAGGKGASERQMASAGLWTPRWDSPQAVCVCVLTYTLSHSGPGPFLPSAMVGKDGRT